MRRALPILLAVLAAACGGTATSNPLEGFANEQGDTADVDTIIVAEFDETADLSGAFEIADWDERGRFVLDTLRETAENSQLDAIAFADEAGIEATSFWIDNVLVFEGTDALAHAVANLPGVVRVFEEPIHRHVHTDDFTEVAEADVPELLWNTDQLASDVPGFGSGIVVGIIDTGVDVTHPALAGSYRGASSGEQPGHDYNWYDPSDTCGDVPCDDDGHGTHVAGVAVGGAGPSPDVGIAPDAAFIAAKGCAPGNCPLTDLLAAAQFMLAPTKLDGSASDPSLRPHVVNNSWDLSPEDRSMDRVVEAWQAAGIIPVFAAGNAGPECGTVGAPANLGGVVAVAAIDGDDAIDPFSSRGPSATEDAKPDLTAPGVAIVSALPDGAYGTASGSSMAAPHVTGAIARALSLASGRVDVEDIIGSLTATARPLADSACGSTGTPNHTFGAGALDVDAYLRSLGS